MSTRPPTNSKGRPRCGRLAAILLLAGAAEIALALATFQAAAAGPRRPAAADSSATPWGRKVVAAAQWYRTQRNPRPPMVRRDCSGLIQSILNRAGNPVEGSSRTFWQDAVRDRRIRKSPKPGDLVFFDATYDANGNGEVDDELTHVAVVVEILPDATLVMIHYGSSEIRSLRMNLAHPDLHRRDGEILNDYLRSPRYGPPEGHRLAGQLFRGFARPPPPPR